MFPIALDLTRVAVLLVGRPGRMLERRIKQLEESGAKFFYVCHPDESQDPRLSFNSWLGVDASLRWHDSKIIMAAGLESTDAEFLAQRARAAGKLINVEDVIDLCDFYFTANVRRGDLLIAVSTGGASPTLARRVRDYIGRRFGEEWAGHTQEMAQERNALRAKGAGMKEVLDASDVLLERKGWLSCKACPKEAA
jgi:precorrin-2 dehydrogenase/sirohydrochlorin ferrochelatase